MFLYYLNPETRAACGAFNLGKTRAGMSETTWRSIGRFSVTLTCALPVLFLLSGCISARSGRDLKALGLEYHLQELKDPRPNRVHVLRVDLAGKTIQPAVIVAADPDADGPAEAALTDPLKLARDRSILALVNTNPWDGFPDTKGKRDRSWFEGQPVDIHGLAVSSGQRRSLPLPGKASVWVDAHGHVFLGDAPTDGSVVEGMAGFQPIVSEGAVCAPSGGAIHPRTAIGIDRNGIEMWLVVVDGRQKDYSEGMSLHELGRLMLDLGCWSAINMDGGGSSIMAVAGKDGQLHVVNSPSDRSQGLPKIRPLPMILTIKEKANSKLSVQ